MADFVKLNGYNVKDQVARNNINNINSTLSGIKRPEDFGCIGNGIVDDTENFQRALTGGGYLLCTPNKKYLITDTLRLDNNTVIDLNYATIFANNISRIFYNFTDEDTEVLLYNGKGNITIKNGVIEGGCISFIHSHDIILDNVHFFNVNNDHILEICACNNYKIVNCIFEGLSNLYPSVREYINIDPCIYAAFPWLPEGSNTFDNTKNKNIMILNNIFKTSNNLNYAYMQRAVGCHSYQNVRHENIVIDGNIVEGNNDTIYSFVLTDMKDVLVSNNMLKTRYGIEINGCDYVVIEGNRAFCNDSTPKTFLIPNTDNVSTHISITNNTLVNRAGWTIGGFNAGGMTIDLLQPTVAFSGDKNVIDTQVPLSQVNQLTLQLGAVGGGNLNTAIVRSFFSRGFAVGENYPLVLKNGLANLAITGEKQITITTNTAGVATNCRLLLIEKTNEFTI